MDVTQILGRVLRQPYVMHHANPMLNLSYVITASAKFNETLQNIIKGLQESGFSEKDYRGKDAMVELIIDKNKQSAVNEFLNPEENISNKSTENLIDTGRISFNKNSGNIAAMASVIEIENMAIRQSEEMEKQIANQTTGISADQLFSEVGIKVKQYAMRQDAAAQAKKIMLPKFVLETPNLGHLDMGQGCEEFLDRINLLGGFKLAEKDIDINFDSISSDLYKIDIEHTGTNEYKMSPFKIENQLHDELIEYVLAKPREIQIKDITHQVIVQIGNMYPIPDPEIKRYVNRILNNMNTGQLKDFLQHKLTYTDKIKQKIKSLADVYAEGVFKDWKEVGIIKTKAFWKFDDAIILNKIASDIGNSLYVHEGEMNGLEQQFIMEISGYSNIAFWHRNLGKSKGFALNGYKANHYPDFIIVTKKNKIILVETKGSDRDNSDSEAKLRLGKAWAELSGPDYKYMMVFDKNAIDGAVDLDKAKELIRQM